MSGFWKRMAGAINTAQPTRTRDKEPGVGTKPPDTRFKSTDMDLHKTREMLRAAQEALFRIQLELHGVSDQPVFQVCPPTIMDGKDKVVVLEACGSTVAISEMTNDQSSIVIWLPTTLPAAAPNNPDISQANGDGELSKTAAAAHGGQVDGNAGQ